MLAAQLDKILVQAKDGCLDADPPLSKLSSEQRKQQLAKSNRVKIIKYFFAEMGRVIKRPQEAAKYKLGRKVQELSTNSVIKLDPDLKKAVDALYHKWKAWFRPKTVAAPALEQP